MADGPAGVSARTSSTIFSIFLSDIAGEGYHTALLSCVALYYALFRPAIRKKADYYLTRRFNTRNPLSKLLHCYRIYVDLGKALIDRATIGIKGVESIDIVSHNLDKMLILIREGHGLILLTAHVGCWQIAMAQLRSLNAPVSLLLHREEGDVDLHYFEHTGIASPFPYYRSPWLYGWCAGDDGCPQKR